MNSERWFCGRGGGRRWTRQPRGEIVTWKTINILILVSPVKVKRIARRIIMKIRRVASNVLTVSAFPDPVDQIFAFFVRFGQGSSESRRFGLGGALCRCLIWSCRRWWLFRETLGMVGRSETPGDGKRWFEFLCKRHVMMVHWFAHCFFFSVWLMIYAKRIEWERRDIETQPKENKQMLKENKSNVKLKLRRRSWKFTILRVLKFPIKMRFFFVWIRILHLLVREYLGLNFLKCIL